MSEMTGVSGANASYSHRCITLTGFYMDFKSLLARRTFQRLKLGNARLRMIASVGDVKVRIDRKYLAGTVASVQMSKALVFLFVASIQ